MARRASGRTQKGSPLNPQSGAVEDFLKRVLTYWFVAGIAARRRSGQDTRDDDKTTRFLRELWRVREQIEETAPIADRPVGFCPETSALWLRRDAMDTWLDVEAITNSTGRFEPDTIDIFYARKPFDTATRRRINHPLLLQWRGDPPYKEPVALNLAKNRRLPPELLVLCASIGIDAQAVCFPGTVFCGYNDPSEEGLIWIGVRHDATLPGMLAASARATESGIDDPFSPADRVAFLRRPLMQRTSVPSNVSGHHQRRVMPLVFGQQFYWAKKFQTNVVYEARENRVLVSGSSPHDAPSFGAAFHQTVEHGATLACTVEVRALGRPQWGNAFFRVDIDDQDERRHSLALQIPVDAVDVNDTYVQRPLTAPSRWEYSFALPSDVTMIRRLQIVLAANDHYDLTFSDFALDAPAQ